MSEIVSRPYHSGDRHEGCQACAWGRGEHAGWCENRPRWVTLEELQQMPRDKANRISVIQADPCACRAFVTFE